MILQRGEIYFVNLNPVQGREQAGQRSVLILSVHAINRLPLVQYLRQLSGEPVSGERMDTPKPRDLRLKQT